MRYYVQAAGLRSQEFAVDVVDLPRITNLKLTYNYPNWTKLEPQSSSPATTSRPSKARRSPSSLRPISRSRHRSSSSTASASR
jgi:hypothetical protein